jgi:hypothetical protein
MSSEVDAPACGTAPPGFAETASRPRGLMGSPDIH